MKNRATVYARCVAEAKVCVKKRQELRIKIATLAIEACDIRHGGGERDYPLSQFAKDIGLNINTLTRWVSAKVGVIDKLPKKEFKTPRQVDAAFSTLRQVGRNATPAVVQREFESQMADTKSPDFLARGLVGQARRQLRAVEDQVEWKKVSPNYVVRLLHYHESIVAKLKKIPKRSLREA